MDPTLLGQPMSTPTAQRPSTGPPLNIILMIVGVLAVVIVGFFMLTSAGDKSAPLRERLIYRQANTLAIIKDGQKNIQSADLQKINSDLALVLTSDDAAVAAVIKKVGPIKKPNKAIKASETNKQALDELKAAELNGLYDKTYQDVLTQQLESLIALLRETHSETKSKSLKDVLNSEYKHLVGYLEQLKAFRA